MGIFDELKHKAEELGEKAKEGLGEAVDKAGDLLGDAREKAGDLLEDARERIGGDHAGDHAPTGESEDIGPDSSSTDAVAPGYVTGEDAADDAGAQDDADDADDAEGLDEETAGSDADLGADSAESDLVKTDPGVLVSDGPAVGPDGSATPADDATATGEAGSDEELEPVATDVDPYEQPLSESIGAEIAGSDVDPQALAEAVGSSDTDTDSER